MATQLYSHLHVRWILWMQELIPFALRELGPINYRPGWCGQGHPSAAIPATLNSSH